ncbi:MAG: site-specific DNA-methyltransferase [Gammaproteobacteria bacterium]|nr:site-specific DNA-methyltransferase [Gammaproteobacteria bacterium]
MTRKQKNIMEQYAHTEKERVNNPPVGLVTPQTDPDRGARKQYEYNPHLDPQLQWAGKVEQPCFDVPTVSLHVHERIDPKTILEAVRKFPEDHGQQSLFDNHKPLREAVEFYQHKDNWSNRLIAGDSLLVMNSLLEKEAMANKVQMVYFDPPYGIKYGSNFQPFVNQNQVKDGQDEDLSGEPEMIKAFRDTWELGIHSYLSYLRDRLLLVRELLDESGSVLVQIGDENVHRVGMVLDEVFGAANRLATISFATTSGSSTANLPQVADYLLWYGKDTKKTKYRQLYDPLTRAEIIDYFNWDVMVELADGSRRKLTDEERFDPDRYLPEGARIYQRTALDSQGVSTTGRSEPYEYEGRTFHCSKNRQWSISREGMDRLAEQGRLEALSGQSSLRWKKYEDEVPGRRINNLWPVKMYPSTKKYVVETATKAIQRCILMTTDPGDLVLDITCGSGTTAFVAEQWGRRWMTCDTSRVALALARQRLMTASFDYYQLAYPDEGISSGLQYKTVPKVSPSILAGQEQTAEVLYDQPFKERGKARIAGPFTVEAVPAPYAKSMDEIDRQAEQENAADLTVARTGETLRQSDLRDELLRCGVRGKNGQKIMFSRVEVLSGTRYLQAEAETRPVQPDSARETSATVDEPLRTVISFGPEHAPLEPRQVELALDEAGRLRPKPQMILFAAFQFDPEAAKDIDETNWPGVTLLKVQMNADLQTGDLKKKRASNESFWLVGQPDVNLYPIHRGEATGKWQVEVRGFDYFNPKTGEVESGDENKIAVWMLDTDYDGRSLYPRQVFFPMAGPKDGWAKLARNLRAEIDEEMIEAYRGSLSLPFELGNNERIAVKIVDDRGIESLRVVERYK